MFCIPGIAQLDHLKACADAGLQFVRIGTNVHQHKEADPFIALAHKLGLFVCTNFMKSYVTPPAEFAKVVRYSAEAGSEMIYLVDSAGGMLPNDVRDYFEAMRSVTDVMLGFHGHNNLGLAVANSLVALDTGATVIDVTLLGMGRSSGNAPTEVLAPLMQRRYGACKNIDPLMLLALGEQAIAPLIKNRWKTPKRPRSASRKCIRCMRPRSRRRRK
jgi:4-hydroxy-2-oxovalerate aldolase